MATGWIISSATAPRSGSIRLPSASAMRPGRRRNTARARKLVDESRGRDLVRGFTLIYIMIAAAIWLVSLALLVYLAHRLSAPIQQLTAGLSQLAAGKLETRVEARRDDEIGRAIQAFNDMAGQLQERTGPAGLPDAAGELADAGAQDGARGEELADADPADRGRDGGAQHRRRERAFLEQAAQIVVDEIEGAGAARARVFGIRRRAAAVRRGRSMSTRWSKSASRS